MIPVHIAVLPDKVAQYMVPVRQDALVIDGTLGEGGHSELLLSLYPECHVVGIDADALMGERALERLKNYSGRFELRIGWTDEILSSWTEESPDLVLMDLGISSYHYRERGRGFSFFEDDPLDMRLDEKTDVDASRIVNSSKEGELADLIYNFGEERFSRRIARRIVECRKKSPIRTSSALAEIVSAAIPPARRHGRIHPATRTFQALRIAVNRELERLACLLKSVPEIMAPGACFGVISFHSLEDRMVKHSFRLNDHRFGGAFEVSTPKPLVADEDECRRNPQARSAKFRVLKRPLVEVEQ